MFTRVRQLCTVVDDFERTIEHLTDDLGIGPFKCWHWRPPALYDRTYRGRPERYTMKLGITWLDDLQWEVIQPIDGSTVYRDHLEAHGRGVEHILMDTAPVPFERAAETMASKGHPFAQTARLNPPLKIGRLRIPPAPGLVKRHANLHFGYVAAGETLRTDIELTRYPLGFHERPALRWGEAEFCIPEGDDDFERSLPNQRVRRAVKTTIVTRDLEDTIGHWADVGGVEPWHRFEAGDGEHACALLDDMLIELVQPGEGAGPHREVLDARGEGVMSVGVEAMSGVDDVVDSLTSVGCRKRSGETWGDGVHVEARPRVGTDVEIFEPGVTAASLFASARRRAG